MNENLKSENTPKASLPTTASTTQNVVDLNRFDQEYSLPDMNADGNVKTICFTIKEDVRHKSNSQDLSVSTHTISPVLVLIKEELSYTEPEEQECQPLYVEVKSEASNAEFNIENDNNDISTEQPFTAQELDRNSQIIGNKEDLTYPHIQYQIQTVEKRFQCTLCDYGCITKSTLEKHIKIHTGEKLYKCSICDYRCIQRSTLLRHMKTHTGEKPFQCQICSYRCTRKSDLQLHLKIHTGEKAFKCSLCEYKCIRKRDLEPHIKTHTGEKPFSCSECEYKCICKSTLQKHMKTHSEEKPFKCSVCEYKCLRKHDLQRHMKTHTGSKKSFTCEINGCDYKCALKSILQHHMKTGHS